MLKLLNCCFGVGGWLVWFGGGFFVGFFGGFVFFFGLFVFWVCVLVFFL